LIVALIPGSATVSLRTTSLFEKGGQAKGDLGRNRRREPKTAFSGFPPVHGADLKGQLRAPMADESTSPVWRPLSRTAALAGIGHNGRKSAVT
jgi:hypothetical protein